MEALLVWLAVIVPSAIWGIVCAYKIKTKYAGFLSGAIPWLVLLAYILYDEYYIPYQGGGASMWLLAQLFGGTVAAFVGYQSYKFCVNYVVKK